MKKVSTTIGIPLRNTSPAAIEDFLVDKIRNDLGELKDAVMIRPMLRVDSEDGDLSGNLTSGYGTILLTVQNKTLHVPFIINNKELLPFDTIRMGSDEVSYDMGKLRKLVIALEKNDKEHEENNDVMEVVDIKDVPTHNGFLGTIMAVRDGHKNRDAMGHRDAYEGANFGDLDMNRVMKTASAHVDVTEVFEEFHEKLANVRFFSEEQVTETVEHMAKIAETESQKMIDSLSKVEVATKESEGVKREVAQLDGTNLADAARAASGNDIQFPIYDDNRFEIRNGRVYSHFKDFNPSGTTSKISRVIIDSKGEYAFLTGNEKFMVNTRPPEVQFDIPKELARGLVPNTIYASEENTTTISVPFIVERGFRDSYKDNGILVSVRERMTNTDTLVDPTTNSMFRDAFVCESVFGNKSVSRNVVQLHSFVLLVEKDSDAPIRALKDFEELREEVLQHATDAQDSKNALFLARYLGGERYYIIGENAPLFKFSRKLSGHFTRPDGLFKEGPFQKTAAYDQGNKARLVINEQAKPTTFTVEWAFAKDQEVEGNATQSIEKRKMENLAPAQAKKILQDLGYDARKQQLFFEIAKRNGRYAEFNLPSTQKAAEVSPKDQGLNKAKKGMTNIMNSTLNAKNFVPVMQNFSSDGLTEGAKELFGKQAATSHAVAVEFEKIAETLRGKEWAEIAYMMNMKHHMDKLAEQISEGFVKDADAVFKEAATLKDHIEKKASMLIDFNRQQLVHHHTPLVSPKLVKEALQQFDEFSGYLAATEVMEKQASFFHKGVRSQMGTLGQQAESLMATQKQLADKIRSEVIYLRTLEQKGLQGTPKYTEVTNQAKQLQQEATEIASQIGQLKKQEETLNQGIQSKNRVAAVGLGLPGIAAASYGYEGFKDS